MKAPRRSTTVAVALGLLATGAYAMTPLEHAGRGYQDSQRAYAGTFDETGNDVQSRTFDGTGQLESSGRGSALDKSGSSAANQGAAAVNAWRDASPRGRGYKSTRDSTSQSIDEQVAANQDAYDWSAASSAGSGYTYDSDLNTSAEERTIVQGDKLVVIVPEDRVPDLIAALEQSSDEPTAVTNGDASDPGMIEAHPSNLE